VFFGGAAFPAVAGLLTGFGTIFPAKTFPPKLPTPCSDLAGAVRGQSVLGTSVTITALSQHSFIYYKDSTCKQQHKSIIHTRSSSSLSGEKKRETEGEGEKLKTK